MNTSTDTSLRIQPNWPQSPEDVPTDDKPPPLLNRNDDYNEEPDPLHTLDGSHFVNLRFTQEDLTPAPENFSMVVTGVYRSSFPRPENFAFLEKLKLKSIL